MQIQILFLSNSASSRAIVHAALNSSDHMSAISCTGILELLQQYCQNDCDLILVEPEEFLLAELEILFRFIHKSMPLAILLNEQSEFDLSFFENRTGAEIFTKLAGYLTALPYLIQNFIYRKNDRKERADLPVNIFTNKLECGWCELSAEMKVQRSSASIEQLLEFPQRELTNFRLPELFHPESEKQIDKFLAQPEIENNEFLLEIRSKSGTGDPKYFVVNFQRIKNHLNNTTGWRCDFFYQPLYRPAPLLSEEKVSFAEKLLDVASADFNMTFPVFFRRIAEQCATIIDCEQLTSIRYNAKSEKFLSDAIRGQELPVLALLNHPESSIFSGITRKSSRLHFFSVQENRAIPMPDNFIKTPPGFGLDGGILISFATSNGTPIGCIAIAGLTITGLKDEHLQQLKIVALFVSLLLETYCDKSEQAKKERRLQQILVTGSIFKLQLPMRSLMREMAWAIKFSFDAFLVALALFDKKDGSLGFYAVASDDKHLILSLANERIAEAKFVVRLHDGTVIRKSHQVRDIGLSGNLDLTTGTSGNGFIVTPIDDLDGKMMGAIIICERRNECIFDVPGITILETVAKQIAVGISNRVIYSRVIKASNIELEEVDKHEANGQMSAATDSKSKRGFWNKIFS